MKKVGEILISNGKISKKQLKGALREQVGKGNKLGETLVDLGYISIDDLNEALTNQKESKHTMNIDMGVVYKAIAGLLFSALTGLAIYVWQDQRATIKEMSGKMETMSNDLIQAKQEILRIKSDESRDKAQDTRMTNIEGSLKEEKEARIELLKKFWQIIPWDKEQIDDLRSITKSKNMSPWPKSN